MTKILFIKYFFLNNDNYFMQNEEILFKFFRFKLLLTVNRSYVS